MKTTRFENGLFENAKDETSRGHGLASGTPQRTQRDAPAQCGTPARPGRRPKGQGASPLTRIAAKVDVGFGNALFIRGEGAGLSWDKGQPLECLESSTWIWCSRQATAPVTFKLLINDQLWCRGANMTAAAGAQAEVVPAF